MIEAWVAGCVSGTVTTEDTCSPTITIADPQDTGTILQMTGETWREAAMTTGAGQGEKGITKNPRGEVTEKGGTIEIAERDTDLLHGAEVVRSRPLVKALNLPFEVGEVKKKTIEMSNKIGDRLTRNRRCDRKKGAKGCNMLRVDVRQLRRECHRTSSNLKPDHQG